MVKHNGCTSLIELANKEEIWKVDWSECKLMDLLKDFHGNPYPISTVAIWQIIQWIKHDGLQ